MKQKAEKKDFRQVQKNIAINAEGVAVALLDEGNSHGRLVYRSMERAFDLHLEYYSNGRDVSARIFLPFDDEGQKSSLSKIITGKVCVEMRAALRVLGVKGAITIVACTNEYFWRMNEH